MDLARRTALETLNRCFKSGAWSALTLDSLIKSGELDKRDAAFATMLTFGVIRNCRLLDYWIDGYCGKLDLPVRNILRLGLYQLRFADSVPDSAAVNESVELCKKCGFKSASGLVNAVLRKAAKDEIVYPEDLSVRYSHSDWFTDLIVERKGRDFAEKLLAADNEEAELCFHDGFAEGERYVQDEAAYRAVLMAGPEPGMKVLDCCSAPGGKSFTAAVLMGNSGEIVSCDIHEKKLRLVSENAERLGMDIIGTIQADASEFRPEWKEEFDLVIADVPCSGLGVIRKKPEIRFKTYEEIKNLPEIQKKILNNVSKYVKHGGRLLYSTCTVLEEENENVISGLEGFILRESRTFWPNVDGTDGFYAAVLEKE